MPKTSRGADPSDLLDAAVAALGGAPREGQQKMVAAVSQAVRSGRHLLVQAGTGTGKSLGYLVPLAAHAAETGTPGVVSTATLALQAQVVDRDLPRLSQALRPLLGRELTWQTVKGRAHYVCRQKLVGGFPEDEPEALPGMELVGGAERATDRRAAAPTATSQLGREVARLHRWAQDTETGDRDELVPGVSERAWRQVSVSSRECLGATRCPLAEECHVELARARAKEVDVVVTNHALLAIDAVEDVQLLPEHDVVVIDEAHELVDRVTSVATGSLSAAAVAQAATTARRQGGLDPTSAERLRVASDDLGAVLEEAPVGRYPKGLPEGVRLAVAGVRDAAREALSGLKGEAGSGQTGKDDDGDAAAGKQVARAALSEVFDVAERLVEVAPSGGADGEGSADVAWLEAPGAWRRDVAGEEPRPRVLHVAPLSVAMTLREHLFGGSTVVLTSATLTPGGSFDAAAGALGLQGAGAPQWTALDVGSPFDHARQGILYVAKHLPQPGREGPAPEVLEEVEQLVVAAGGRALGLFSSRRAAEAAAEALGDRLAQHGISVLCQGDDTVPNLVREFAEDPRTCLFGTLTLWQGVDVPGPSCQLVVLDRIPFPRPDDPLSSARAEAADRAGGNGFMAVSATHAALLLAQGAGRLLRSTSDRGVVALLDPRLATKRYGSFLRASLPPLWPTTDREVVLGALRRLDAAASDQEAAASASA